jgi:hypothetical protein
MELEIHVIYDERERLSHTLPPRKEPRVAKEPWIRDRVDPTVHLDVQKYPYAVPFLPMNFTLLTKLIPPQIHSLSRVL